MDDADSRIIFVSGLPRAGTSMTVAWLDQAIAEDHLWLKESGTLNLAHHMLCAMEFERRSHRWGFDLVRDTGRRSVALGHVRRLALDLYGSYGWRRGMPIVDKEPYFASDGPLFYSHLFELFPRLKLICMLRNPRSVISSMMQRPWARGPFPRLNRLSPFSHDTQTLDNCMVDVLPGGPDEPFIGRPGMWSLEKCCASYRSAVRAMDAVAASGRKVLILNYENLHDARTVQKVVEAHVEIDFTTGYTFNPGAPAMEFGAGEEAVLARELGDTGVLEAYARLRDMAAAPIGPRPSLSSHA